MIEADSSEVEKVLLFISDAETRARQATDRLEKRGADRHVIDALRASDEELGRLHRRLMQQTYYAVPSAAQKLAI